MVVRSLTLQFLLLPAETGRLRAEKEVYNKTRKKKKGLPGTICFWNNEGALNKTPDPRRTGLRHRGATESLASHCRVCVVRGVKFTLFEAGGATVVRALFPP